MSHCLLNENVRYLGGATRPGPVAEVVERYVRDGVGIYQMPCPEQRAWGGILKTRVNWIYGSRLLRWAPARRTVVGVARRVTAGSYGRLARGIVADIDDYVSSGFEVTEVVGVGASPSCGVSSTLDLDGAVAAMARCDRCTITPAIVNERVVEGNVVRGSGTFVIALRRHLQKRGLEVAFREHDLLAELRAGQRTSEERASRS